MNKKQKIIKAFLNTLKRITDKSEINFSEFLEEDKTTLNVKSNVFVEIIRSYRIKEDNFYIRFFLHNSDLQHKFKLKPTEYNILRHSVTEKLKFLDKQDFYYLNNILDDVSK